MADRESTRFRIIKEARRLFSAQGFKATTVAEIESAAGLSPGSGAMYAHFSSKEEVLAAAIEDYADTADMGYSLFDLVNVGDLRSELTLFVRGALVQIEEGRELIWILLRESEQFPDLLTHVRERINRRASAWIAGWLREKVKEGKLEDHDCEAVAMIGLGAIAAFWLRNCLFPKSARAIDEERFVQAWVDLMMRLAPPALAKES